MYFTEPVEIITPDVLQLSTDIVYPKGNKLDLFKLILLHSLNHKLW